MGHPDDLTPAQQEQYFNYVEGKVGRSEIPRPPQQWQEVTAGWRSSWLHGHAFERGLDIVFGLTNQGWKSHEQDKVHGRGIVADFHLPGQGRHGVARNIEAKSGAVDKDRDRAQLQGYRAKLEAGEQVTYIIRESAEKRIAPDIRKDLAALERQFPGDFVVKRVNEKVFARIMEAGMRAIERDNRKELGVNLSKLPAPERDPLRLEEISKTIARDIADARHQGKDIGIEQLRLVHQELRDLADAQAKADRAKEVEARRSLGLGYFRSLDVEKAQDQRIRERDSRRQYAIDPITYELIRRERELIERDGQQIAQAMQQGRQPTREDFLGLTFALQKVQQLEQDHHRGIAAAAPSTERQEFLRETQRLQAERDNRTAQQLGAIGKAVEREAARLEHQQLLAAAREETIQRLTPIVGAETARWRAATVTVAPPTGDEVGRDPQEVLRARAEAAARAAEAAREREQREVQARMERGMDRQTAENAAFHRRNNPKKMPTREPVSDEQARQVADRTVEAARIRLVEQGIDPEIARLAAEGRRPAPPKEVDRETPTAEIDGRGKQRERGIGLDR
ncbi:hypothetical protein IU510_12875 [Nocardia cyriacigeorgica]|uniref:hypothetical protein n=1 Tax=Nocardia cyriacigeorgica TaxID=135487 RepID=UPI001895D64B|nr:hypothetical protein [Nocardia cyriacigeorgica]MBF6098971.1 hypothetical protein [Nocardia cyriacigeorgica]